MTVILMEIVLLMVMYRFMLMMAMLNIMMGRCS